MKRFLASIATLLIAGCGNLPGAPGAGPATLGGGAFGAGVSALSFDQGIASAPTGAPLHFFFCSDTHDGYALFDQVIARANAVKPAFVLDGGDLSEQGTANEFKILDTTLGKLTVPFVAVPGNHDYKNNNITRFESAFGETPRSFDAQGVHFVLFDDANQQIPDATFQFLEADLAKNQGKPIVVAMHVPVLWKNTSADLNLLHKVMPGTIAEPKIEDPTQIQRFTDLMSQYHVSLVLSGHTHLRGDYAQGGVPYVVAGAAGGKLINVGASHEYVDVTIDQGKASYAHVALDQPTTSLTAIMTNMAAYYLEQRQEMASGVQAGSQN